MLTGAARRGAASVGSLLIAAVPSSPIESDGFPTSPVVGRGYASVGWLQRSWGQARLACLLLGWFLGGAASDGCFRETTLAWRSVELLPVQLSGLGGFLPSLVIHRENLFCVAVAVGCARRLDICGRYKSLCEATV